MWVLPSRGRPRNLRRLIAAWDVTRASTPLWLRLDEDDKTLSDYLSLTYPVTWNVEVGPRHPLSAIYEEIYSKDPNKHWWGFIADDVVPETVYWDTSLVAVAGLDGMAVPAGSHNQHSVPHFVLGGALVREVGWLSLPGLYRLYIDTVWTDISRSRNVLRHVPSVILSHRHFSNHMAKYDETYVKNNKEHDRRLYNHWREREGEIL